MYRFFLSFLLICCSLKASSSDDFTIISSIPAGFEDMTKDREPIGLYFLKKKLLDTNLSYVNGEAFIVEHDDMIPLGKKISCELYDDFKAKLDCQPGVNFRLLLSSEHGVKKIQVIPESGRITSFINSQHDDVGVDKLEILPVSEQAEFSGIISLSSTVNLVDRNNGLSTNLNTSVNSILSYSNYNLEVEGYLSASDDYKSNNDLESLVFNTYLPTSKISLGYKQRGGVFKGVSSSSIGRSETVGFWSEENSDRIIGGKNHDVGKLEVYMPADGDVKVFRGDTLLYTGYYKSGLVYISYSELPKGNYEVSVVRDLSSNLKLEATTTYVYNNRNSDVSGWSFGMGIIRGDLSDSDSELNYDLESDGFFIGGSYPILFSDNYSINAGLYHVSNTEYAELLLNYNYEQMSFSSGGQYSSDEQSVYANMILPFNFNGDANSLMFNANADNTNSTGNKHYSYYAGYNYHSMDNILFSSFNAGINYNYISNPIDTHHTQAINMNLSKSIYLFGLPISWGFSAQHDSDGNSSVSLTLDMNLNRSLHQGLNAGLGYGYTGSSSYYNVNASLKDPMDYVDNATVGMTAYGTNDYTVNGSMSMSNPYVTSTVYGSFYQSEDAGSSTNVTASASTNIYLSNSEVGFSKYKYTSAIILDVSDESLVGDNLGIEASLSNRQSVYSLGVGNNVLPMRSFSENSISINSADLKVDVSEFKSTLYPGNIEYKKITPRSTFILGGLLDVESLKDNANYPHVNNQSDGIKISNHESEIKISNHESEIKISNHESEVDMGNSQGFEYFDMIVSSNYPEISIYVGGVYICTRDFNEALKNSDFKRTGFLYIEKVGCD